MFDLPLIVSDSKGLAGTTESEATLVGGYPVATPFGITDLTNQDCTVVSDGIHPVLLYAQAGFVSTGAGTPTVTLEIRENLTVIDSTAQDKIGATGTAGDLRTLSLASSRVLVAGIHTLKLSLRKNATGAGQVTSAQGDRQDTFLRAVY